MNGNFFADSGEGMYNFAGFGQLRTGRGEVDRTGRLEKAIVTDSFGFIKCCVLQISRTAVCGQLGAWCSSACVRAAASAETVRNSVRWLYRVSVKCVRYRCQTQVEPGNCQICMRRGENVGCTDTDTLTHRERACGEGIDGAADCWNCGNRQNKGRKTRIFCSVSGVERVPRMFSYLYRKSRYNEGKGRFYTVL